MKEIIEQKVKEGIALRADIPVESIQLDSVFNQDIELDSLNYTDLAMEFEYEYQIAFDFQEAVKIQTVGELVDYICQLIDKKS